MSATLSEFIKEDVVSLDAACRSIVNPNINMTVPWYLMAAYAYYVEDSPILSDQLFDELCKTMLKHWDEIEHFHKEYITKDHLAAGTFLGKYPSRVEDALHSLKDIYYGKSTDAERTDLRSHRRGKNSRVRKGKL